MDDRPSRSTGSRRDSHPAKRKMQRRGVLELRIRIRDDDQVVIYFSTHQSWEKENPVIISEILHAKIIQKKTDIEVGGPDGSVECGANLVRSQMGNMRVTLEYMITNIDDKKELFDTDFRSHVNDEMHRKHTNIDGFASHFSHFEVDDQSVLRIVSWFFFPNWGTEAKVVCLETKLIKSVWQSLWRSISSIIWCHIEIWHQRKSRDLQSSRSDEK